MTEHFQKNNVSPTFYKLGVGVIFLCALNLVFVYLGVFVLRNYLNDLFALFVIILSNAFLVSGLIYFLKREQRSKEKQLLKNIIEVLSEDGVQEELINLELLESRFLKFKKAQEHKSEYIERSLKTAERQLEKLNAELEEAKINIEEAATSKGTFLANVSHELRTPLNAILGYSQILKRDSEWFSEVHRNGINIIQQSGEHLLNIINEILDFSKLDAHKTQLESKPFNLLKTINQVTSMMEVRAREKGLDFQQNISQDIPELVNGDEQKLKQVLINLMGNAIKFTDAGKVSLSLNKISENGYHFEVEDSGEGIGLEDQKSIFEAFYQINSNNKSKQSGTGLGLPISKRLVELMGGTLELTSEAGVGSVFKFDIALDLAPEETELSQNTKIEGYEGEKREILILGKETQSRFLILETLRRLEFAVIEAEDVLQATNRIKSKRPDLVIIDFRQPFDEFIEFVKKIKIMEADLQRRYDPNLQKIPQPIKFLATSVSIVKEEQEMMLDSGCDTFLRKPFSNTELCEEIEKLLDIKWTINYKARIRNTEHKTHNQRSYLDQSLYDQFMSFAQKGDIRSIKNLAEETAANRQDYQQFTKKVLQLSSQFQINAIRELLSQYAPGNIEDSDTEK